MVGREVPEIIKKLGFDFHWSDSRVWKLKVPVTEIEMKKLEWMFTIPFWNTETGFYDLTPNEVLSNPEKYSSEYKRIQKADIKYPIDIMFNKGRWLILDGLHRLTKATLLGFQKVKVRKVPKSMIKDILKQPAKIHH